MKLFMKITALVLLVVFTAVSPLILDKKLSDTGAEEKQPSVVLTLWHADTFEGGTGSRQDFLMKTATAFEKQNEGVLVSVIKHSEESVRENFSSGVFPDMISFGIGINCVAEYAKPLKTHKNNAFFNSASSGGVQYFYPYAYGRYFIFGAKAKEGKKRGVSAGKNNLPLFAAKRGGFENFEIYEPLGCYTAFVSGKITEMLGTQRDVYRLIRRGVEFTAEPFGDFTDLVQYIAVTAKDDRRAALSEKFAEFLLSEETQERLKEIGLFSPVGAAVDYGEEIVNSLSASAPSAVLSALLDGEKYSELKSGDGKDDIFEKFEKYLRF
ncbi:MAG: hypothetical protein IJU84_08175 [Clostridia bacterium]|nr:hypothetical protein [Clostridia bacterium]